MVTTMEEPPSVGPHRKISLRTLLKLTSLSIYTVPLALDVALSSVASWLSPMKSNPGSSLTLVVILEEYDVDLLHCFLVFGSIRPVIVGSAGDGGSCFAGDLFVLMQTKLSVDRLCHDIDTVDTLLSDLRYDPQVRARVFPVCTLFADVYDMRFCKCYIAHVLSMLTIIHCVTY